MLDLLRKYMEARNADIRRQQEEESDQEEQYSPRQTYREESPEVLGDGDNQHSRDEYEEDLQILDKEPQRKRRARPNTDDDEGTPPRARRPVLE